MFRLRYPVTMAAIADDYHGMHVPEPNRWLEDTDAPDTRKWIEGLLLFDEDGMLYVIGLRSLRNEPQLPR